MKDSLKISIIDTLSYFDLFNYPLTLKQIEFFLHFTTAESWEIEKTILNIQIIEEKYGFYFFTGREEIAIKRKIQEEENYNKLNLAKHYIFYISKIPGVKMIAITGSLAMGNASENDDIDLFIVTRKNMLWTTRLLANLLTSFLGIKRKYKEKNASNKICLNMFLDERYMNFDEHNLYIAHEIAQMKVFYSEGKIFEKFMKKNLWMGDYFPNIDVAKKRKIKIKPWFEFLFFSEKIVRSLNLISFLSQYFYMRKKITNEKVSMRRAFFHPNNHSRYVLSDYKKRKEKYLSFFKLNTLFEEMNLELLLGKKVKNLN